MASWKVSGAMVIFCTLCTQLKSASCMKINAMISQCVVQIVLEVVIQLTTKLRTIILCRYTQQSPQTVLECQKFFEV